MTDRHAGYLVTLEHNTREDDAEATLGALKQIKGVLSVIPVTGSSDLSLAEERVRHELGTKLLAVIWPER